MAVTPNPPITDQETAEVIDLIEQLNKESDTQQQSLALCRSVADLSIAPKLAVFGTYRLIQHGLQSGSKLDLARAATALDKLMEKHPNERWIVFRCAHHYGEIGQIEKAIAAYDKAIDLKPSAKAHYQVAMLHKKQMQFEDCIEHLEDTLQLNADHLPARGELLYLMAMKGDLERFNAHVSAEGLSQDQLARSYNRLGQTLVYFGERQQAMEWFDKAVQLQPQSFDYQWSKHLTVPTIYRNDEDLSNSRQQYLRGLETITTMYENLPDAERNQAHRCTEKLTNFEIHYQSDQDMEVQRPYGALLHRIMSHSYPQYSQSLVRKHPEGRRRIRIGFASWGCFFTHSNYKTHGTLITELDQDRFEVFAYALSPTIDRTTEEIKQRCEHYLPFGGSVEALRQRIHDDQLDILVYPGIGMEPIAHRLATLRLAPVQCTSWGHPVTSGLPTIDYYLSSDLMEPENAQENYSEKLIRLPNLGVSQMPPGLPNFFREPELLKGRPRPATIFLCSQNILKMMPRHDYLFARILKNVPDSEIWFIQSKRQDITDTFSDRLRTVCQSYGLDFAKRCLLLPRLGKAEFCYVNEFADIMLDTSFWSGCNTTFETLVHGTPVITLPGTTMRGRHTAAILQLHSLDQLICNSEQEYIALAEKLAHDKDFYSEIKQQIDSVQGDLFGDETVIQALEDFFEQALRGETQV